MKKIIQVVHHNIQRKCNHNALREDYKVIRIFSNILQNEHYAEDTKSSKTIDEDDA